MPIYVGDGNVFSTSESIGVKNSSNQTLFEQGISSSGFGYLSTNGRPAFIAGNNGSGNAWVSWSGWSKVNNYCNYAIYNKGNHYDTVNTRFNVPITGPYLFIWTSYSYTDNYIHPQISVNGGEATRRITTPYRMRGYGFVANYQNDMATQEIIYCIAGDYVEARGYGTGTAYHYTGHDSFMGVYVG